MKIISIKKKVSKQIRSGVFESNSSSTHSVTIRNKRSPKDPKPTRELVKDNILYPNVLTDYTMSFSYDSSSTCCDTKDKKAAIVCNWVNNATEYAFYDDGKRDLNKRKTFVAEVLQKFVKACGYDGVDVDNLSNNFYSSSEYGDDPLPNIEDGDEIEDFKNAVMALVEIVLDDDMIIEESDIEN